MNVNEFGVSTHTLSGCKHGQTPRFPLLARASAASAAGFGSVGACWSDFDSSQGCKFTARHLASMGIRVKEVEWLDLAYDPDAEQEHAVFKMASILGATRVNVGFCESGPVYETTVVRRLRHIAQRAAEHGMTVAVEPVAFGSLSTLAAVENLIVAADMGNVGLLLDVYHWAREKWSAHVPLANPGMVAAIQLCGVDRADPLPAWPKGLFAESQCGRRLPHEGDFPVGEWLADLAGQGVSAPVWIEVISDEMRAMCPLDAAHAVAASVRSLGAPAVSYAA